MKRKIGNSWGVGGLYMTPLERKFREAGGSNRKNHPWGGGGYGYFLEPHNVARIIKGMITQDESNGYPNNFPTLLLLQVYGDSK